MIYRIKHKEINDTWVARTPPLMFEIYGPNHTIYKTAAWSAKNRKTLEKVLQRMRDRRKEIKRMEPDRKLGLQVDECWEITEEEE